MKLFTGKKHGQLKGMISMRMLILSYTIQQVIVNVCTKFQNPTCSSPKKSLTNNFIGEEDRQIKGKINMRMPILSYTIQHAIPNVCTKF